MSHQLIILLDLSAAFDTIDHTFLLERLSAWFGITYTALLGQILSSQSLFLRQIEDSVSPVYQIIYGVPQGFVLGPLLFILYTTPIALSFLTHLQIITSMHMTLNFTYRSQRLVFLST